MRHLNNGTDHRHSKSRCDQSSPARRTTTAMSIIVMVHYSDVIMTTMASQFTSLTVVYSIVYSDADQRKHQRSASLAFVWGIHRWPVNSPHKGPVTREMSPFDGVIMRSTRRQLTWKPVSWLTNARCKPLIQWQYSFHSNVKTIPLRLNVFYIQNPQTIHHIDRFVQERRNSSALAMELRLSCTNPSIW